MFLSTTRYSQANTIGFIFHETIRPASRLGSIGRCDSIRRISRCFRRRAHWHAFILSSELGAGGMLTKSPRTHRNSSQNRVAESNPPLREDTAARLPAKISATRPLFNLSKNLGVVCIKVVLFASDCATSSAIIAVSRKHVAVYSCQAGCCWRGDNPVLPASVEWLFIWDDDAILR